MMCGKISFKGKGKIVSTPKKLSLPFDNNLEAKHHRRVLVKDNVK
jgi:hypothetical protein